MSEIRVDNITDEAGTGAPEIVDHYKKSNILGAVSESGGVPTGAIIERGSNANGEFVKYADGTMICSINNFTVDINSQRESGVYNSPDSGEFTWNFPANFSGGVLSVSGSTIGDGTSGNADSAWSGIFAGRRLDNSSTLIRGFNIRESTTNVPCAASAIGRWY